MTNIDITVEELHERRKNGENPIVIDVREVYEFDDFNIGGKLIPLGTLPAELDELESIKDQEIIVHCRSGARSAAAKDLMMRQGFTHVRNLLGGILDWEMKFGR